MPHRGTRLTRLQLLPEFPQLHRACRAHADEAHIAGKLSLRMSAIGPKRTCLFALQMSAFDPKRTWLTSTTDLPVCYVDPARCLVPSLGGGNETARVHQPSRQRGNCW